MLVIRKNRDKEPKGLDGREKSGICIFEEEREKEKEKEKEWIKREKRKGAREERRRTEPKKEKEALQPKLMLERHFP